MSTFVTWLYIFGALIVALLANSLSAIWASKPDRLNPWLIAVILIGPLVFITFGLVASRVGVAMSSATIDSLLTVSTIVIGLILFHEWSKIGPMQYVGLALVLVGICLIQFFAKPTVY